MKRLKIALFVILLLPIVLAPGAYVGAYENMIIDHTCTDLTQIPESAITDAKEILHIAYGHTSHGSQLTEGMEGLMAFQLGYDTLYAINRAEHSDLSDGALHIHDTYNTGQSNGLTGDLGSGGSTLFANRTREYLATHPDTNVIMWSWCGGVSYTNASGIQLYLEAMNQLEIDYPYVRFVYMTGHLDGTGLEGRLHQNNEIIRAYCRDNNKILFDFADIESYDPDGNYYGDKYATDACNYDANGDGQTDETDQSVPMPLNGDRNWAIEWQDANPDAWYLENPRYPDNRPSHTQHVNGNLKAYAAWWMFARMAGWLEVVIPVTEAPVAPSNLQVSADSSDEISVSWTHSSVDENREEGFILERRTSSTSYEVVTTRPANRTSYNDTGLQSLTRYYYRVKAFNTIGESAYSEEMSATTLDPTLEPVEEEVISVGATWRYFKGTEEPPSDWKEVSFDDAAWLNGATGIGYGDGDDETTLGDMAGNYVTVYMRKTFTNDFASINSMVFSIDYDDGFVAYLNGTEIERENVSGDPAYNVSSSGGHEAGSVANYDVTSFKNLLVKGNNTLSIQGRNADLYSSDFSIIPSLSITGIKEHGQNHDVNGDGIVNVQDVIACVNAVLSGADLDVNGDGSTDIMDVITIVNAILDA